MNSDPEVQPEISTYRIEVSTDYPVNVLLPSGATACYNSVNRIEIYNGHLILIGGLGNLLGAFPPGWKYATGLPRDRGLEE